MFHPVNRIVGFIVKLCLGLMAAVFAVSILAAALVVLLLSVLKSLITGRKPAPAAVFSRFQQFSPQGMWPGNARQSAAGATSAQVVDVEAREIRDDKRQD